MIQHGNIEASKVKKLGDCRVQQKFFNIRRRGLAFCDLYYICGAIARRQLNNAKPVAVGLETQCFGIYGNTAAILVQIRQVAFVKSDGQFAARLITRCALHAKGGQKCKHSIVAVMPFHNCNLHPTALSWPKMDIAQ